MAKRLIYILVTVATLAGLVVGGLYWRWHNSPRYSLHHMVLALQINNIDKFTSYIDLKAIFENLVQHSSQELIESQKPDEDEWTRLGRRLGKKLAQQVLPKVFDNFETQIRSLLKQYLLTLDNTQVLAIAAAVSLAEVQVQGNMAQVTVKDPRGSIAGQLRFQMRRNQDNRWVVSEVNYQDLKKILKHELL
jgi:hypothetical protein